MWRKPANGGLTGGRQGPPALAAETEAESAKEQSAGHSLGPLGRGGGLSLPLDAETDRGVQSTAGLKPAGDRRPAISRPIP